MSQWVIKSESHLRQKMTNVGSKGDYGNGFICMSMTRFN